MKFNTLPFVLYIKHLKEMSAKTIIYIRKLNSYTKIVSDAYVDGNYLYVLLFGTGSSGEVLSNEILKIELSPILKKKEILQLPGTNYLHICVNQDSIYAYNRKEARVELLVRE